MLTDVTRNEGVLNINNIPSWRSGNQTVRGRPVSTCGKMRGEKRGTEREQRCLLE